MAEQFDTTSNAFIARDEQGIARSVSHFHQPFISTATTPEQAAREYLDQYGGLLGISNQELNKVDRAPERAMIDAPVEYRIVSSKTLFDTTTVTFQQTCFGLPVWGAGVSVTVQALPQGAAALQVIGALSTAHPDAVAAKPPAAALRRLSTLEASSLATALGLTNESGEFNVRSLRIDDQRLVIYQYQAALRVLAPQRPAEKTGVAAADHLTLPLPPVPEAIAEGQHYVAAEVYFSLASKRYGELNWVAIIEAKTQTVLYLRAFVSDVNGLVFEHDPMTSHGGPGPDATNAQLNPRRTSVTLPGLNPPGGGRQGLTGAIIEVRDNDPPTIAPPTVPVGNHFDYNARTNDFAAVNAYYHNDRFFRLVEDLGFPLNTYFSGTTFPTPVDHRGRHLTTDGIEVNAACFGVSGGGGILRTAYALAHTGDTTNPVGIACDWRVVLHELGGHGILYNHISSANFGFAHSAGDSFAAILNDPETQAPDRFVTFPWVGGGRRHDRTPAAGWGWAGDIARHPFDTTLDNGGYNNEQILATTHFRIYRSIGGDSDDVNRRRFAARCMAYLMLRAVSMLRPATNPQNALGFASALITADAGDWISEGLAGHIYGKVIRWAFEKQGLYQPTGASLPNNNEGSPPPVDVYIEDGRHGEYQYQPNHQNGLAIWNRRKHDGGHRHQPPIAGVPNYAYVRIKNRGTQTATGVVVRGFHSQNGAGTDFPNDWQPMTTAALAAPDVAANNAAEITVGPFEWTPSQVDEEYMFLVVSASGDPTNIDSISPGQSVADWRLVPNDNNIGERKVAPVEKPLSAEVPFISTWLVLGPIFDPSHQTGSHLSGDLRPPAHEIISDIDHHAHQVNPWVLTQAVNSAPGVGDIVHYGGQGADGRTVLAGRWYAWRKRYFAGLDWQSVSDVGDNMHTHLVGDYDDDPFDPYNYLNFAGKHHALALLLVYIISPDERTTRIAVRHDDALRLWLNGSEIVRPGKIPFLNDHDLINEDETHAAIQLKAGVNILLAAVAETHVEWGFSARIEDYEGLRFTADNPSRDPIAAFDSDYHHVGIAGEANSWNPQDPNRVLSYIGSGRWQGRVRMVAEPFKMVGHGNGFKDWWGSKGRNIFGDNFWNALPGIYDVTFDQNNPTQPVFILVKPFGKRA